MMKVSEMAYETLFIHSLTPVVTVIAVTKWNDIRRRLLCTHDVGYCEKDGLRIGFGECRGQILPAVSSVDTS